MTWRLAIVASHVIQYQDPLFRRIAAEPDIDLTVLYCWRAGMDAFHDPDMKTNVTWDIELLHGYRHRFLFNLGRARGDGGFFRFINPGIVPAMLSRSFDAVIFMTGWGTATSQLGMLACRTARVPFFIFGDSSFPPPETTLRGKLRAKILRALFRGASGFMVSGGANADYYTHYGADPSRFFLLPFAVDNERFAAAAALAPDEREALRARFDIAPDSVAIVFSGKLVDRKDPMTLLLAYERMRLRDRATLVFIGDGALRESLERHAREHALSGVRFIGFINQTELPKLYAMCDVFALPSLFEPRGLVVNEAMACGLPVVVSDRCGCIGDIARDGDNALVHRTGDADDAAEKLDRLAGDAALRESMGRRSREIIGDWTFERGVVGVRAMLRTVKE
jgi:glycosyltransferase involved in cell wall biosynthesis